MNFHQCKNVTMDLERRAFNRAHKNAVRLTGRTKDALSSLIDASYFLTSAWRSVLLDLQTEALHQSSRGEIRLT